MNEETRIVVDANTGECVSTLLPGDRILRQKVIDRLQQEEGNGEHVRFAPERWGKAYDGALQKLAVLKLSAVEYQVILFVLPLVKTGSGLLVHRNFKPVHMEYISESLSLSHRTASAAVKRLVDLRVMFSGECGNEKQFYFNPYIYSRGGYINSTLRDMFKSSTWAQQKRKPQSGHSYKNDQNQQNG